MERSGAGRGIGGGVMLNVTRILFLVDIGLLALNTILSVIKGQVCLAKIASAKR